MILIGETFGAHKLLERGVLNNVEEEGVLDTSISTIIEKMILQKSSSFRKRACCAARMILLSNYQHYINKLEALYLDVLMSTKDATERVNSFAEKRSPTWVNA